MAKGKGEREPATDVLATLDRLHDWCRRAVGLLAVMGSPDPSRRAAARTALTGLGEFDRSSWEALTHDIELPVVQVEGRAHRGWFDVIATWVLAQSLGLPLAAPVIEELNRALAELGNERARIAQALRSADDEWLTATEAARWCRERGAVQHGFMGKSNKDITSRLNKRAGRHPRATNGKHGRDRRYRKAWLGESFGC